MNSKQKDKIKNLVKESLRKVLKEKKERECPKCHAQMMFDADKDSFVCEECGKKAKKSTNESKVVSLKEFAGIVQQYVKEAIQEEMVDEISMLKLKELGTPPPVPAAAKVQGKPQATPPPPPPESGIRKPARDIGDGITVAGTNMNLNQFLQATAAEKDPAKKQQMLKQASQVIATMNTLEEGDESGNSSSSQDEWKTLYRAFGKAMGTISDSFDKLLDEMVKSGMRPAEATKKIREVETTIENMMQDLQMSKDVTKIRSRMEKAANKNAMLKRFLPLA